MLLTSQTSLSVTIFTGFVLMSCKFLAKLSVKPHDMCCAIMTLAFRSFGSDFIIFVICPGPPVEAPIRTIFLGTIILVAHHRRKYLPSLLHLHKLFQNKSLFCC